MASRSPAEETATGAPVAPSAEQKPAELDSQADAPSEQAIQGFIERIEPKRVSGWAWDRLAPEVFLEIEIVLDGKILATTRADRFREDLKRGTGDGRHAFQAFFDDPVPEQMKHCITALARSRHGGAATPLVNLVCDRPADPAGESAVSAVTTPDETQPVETRPVETRPVETRPVEAQPVDAGPVAAGARQWLVQLAAVDRKLQATCSTALGEIQEALAAVAATAAEVEETVKDLRVTQEQLAQQLAALEVFQVRFDTTLKGMEEKGTGAGGSRRPDRGLRAAVAALAAISTASLAVGLWSIIGG